MTHPLWSEDGAKVIEDAKRGKEATLRLEATLETSEAYQYITLPGADYGTPDDEQIVLVNHTDGPSITQDNGALGILSIVKYFSNIPQHERPRTLVIFLDCRHYIPGMESAHSAPDWFTRFPEKKEKIVALIQAEHLGEMDYREVDGVVEPTGYAEQSYLWTRNNEQLITAAIDAVSRYGWSRAQVSVPERRGSVVGFSRYGGVLARWGRQRLATTIAKCGTASTCPVSASVVFWVITGRPIQGLNVGIKTFS